MEIKIFPVFHRPFFMWNDEIFEPIIVGDQKEKFNKDVLRDDTGDNISDKNWLYAELSAYYWVWKNYDLSSLDYVGFCHYRRYFIFDENLSNIFLTVVNKGKIIKYKLFDLDKNCIINYDLILPKKINIDNKSLKEQYIDSHGYGNLKILEDVLYKRYFDRKKDIELVFQKKENYYFNMFIAKKDIFIDYMEFAFSILFEIEDLITIPNDDYQRKVLGFLGERLFNVYVELNKDKLKINELGVLFFENYIECSGLDLNKLNIKNKKIILYGFGREGRRVYNILLKNKIPIHGIIDDFHQNEKSICFNDFLNLDDNDTIIVIGESQKIYHDINNLKSQIFIME